MPVFDHISIGGRTENLKEILYAEKSFLTGQAVKCTNADEIPENMIREHLLSELLANELLSFNEAKENLLATFHGPSWKGIIEKKFEAIWDDIADYEHLPLSKLRLRMTHLRKN